MEPQESLVGIHDENLAVPFPLVKELFDEGEKTFGGPYNSSSGEYFNTKEVPSRTKLASKYTPLTLGHDASSYYLAYYEDRQSSYFSEDTQGREVCISTQPGSYTDNSKMQALTYSEKKDGMYLLVSETIGARAHEDFDDNGQQGLVEPSGHMRAKYKLITPLKKDLVELSASRVDEVMFENQGERQPGRWTRNLRIDAATNTTDYGELYILNRSSSPGDESRADVKFMAKGDIAEPQEVIVQFGFGPSELGKTVMEDKDKNVRVIVQNGHEKDLAILQSDPNFTFLTDSELKGDEVLAFLQERIRLMQLQWDQPQSIYAATIGSADTKALTSK